MFAYTVNGGRINGKITDTLTVGASGRVVFSFQAGEYFGDYPIVLRYGGQEQVITLWVYHAELDAAAEDEQ
ncbi:MAG: hypothetical protein V1784_02015 [bacterium]